MKTDQELVKDCELNFGKSCTMKYNPDGSKMAVPIEQPASSIKYDPNIICKGNAITIMARKRIGWIPWLGFIIGIVIAISWFSDAFAEGGEFAVILIPTILVVAIIPIIIGIVLYAIIYASMKKKLRDDCFKNPQNYGSVKEESRFRKNLKRSFWRNFFRVSRYRAFWR